MIETSYSRGRPRRRYDHRVRALVHHTGDPELVSALGIPRSTAASWRDRGPIEVVTFDLAGTDVIALQAEAAKLRRRVRVLIAVMVLLRAMLRVSGFRLDQDRLPQGDAKRSLLVAAGKASATLRLTSVLHVLGLSSSRYHAWRRAEIRCELDDRSSCPQTSPTQVTPSEASAIKDMVTSPDFRHMPMRVLALYAQRIERVFVSVSTWLRLVRERGWRRPRARIYPARPKTGVRAGRPNEIWHIDITVVRLLSGTRVYVQAVIDNFSRKILAWRVTERLEPRQTCLVLKNAAQFLSLETQPIPALYADSGIENINYEVDDLEATGIFHRVLAQIDVSFSNSMIEAFWKSLRHQWLYLNTLNTIEDVRRLVEFYVTEHNTRMPHAAFRGQTPDEIFFGTSAAVEDELAMARQRARRQRMEINRRIHCRVCPAKVRVAAGGTERVCA